MGTQLKDLSGKWRPGKRCESQAKSWKRNISMLSGVRERSRLKWAAFARFDPKPIHFHFAGSWRDSKVMHIRRMVNIKMNQLIQTCSWRLTVLTFLHTLRFASGKARSGSSWMWFVEVAKIKSFWWTHYYFVKAVWHPPAILFLFDVSPSPQNLLVRFLSKLDYPVKLFLSLIADQRIVSSETTLRKFNFQRKMGEFLFKWCWIIPCHREYIWVSEVSQQVKKSQNENVLGGKIESWCFSRTFHIPWNSWRTIWQTSFVELKRNSFIEHRQQFG
jgi:hypothetical protein